MNAEGPTFMLPSLLENPLLLLLRLSVVVSAIKSFKPFIVALSAPGLLLLLLSEALHLLAFLLASVDFFVRNEHARGRTGWLDVVREHQAQPLERHGLDHVQPPPGAGVDTADAHHLRPQVGGRAARHEKETTEPPSHLH